MNILITLDYELFFGPNSGSVEKCILEPTQALLDIVEPLDIKFTCFVDSGYLVALERQLKEFPKLKNDYDEVVGQLRYLAHNGHGVELHVHPHWEDSYFDGSQWVFDTSRYKLADFDKNEIHRIVTEYTTVLKKITGQAPIAYRAGGWSAQPFAPIGEALRANGIRKDSTVYPGGYYQSQNQSFDFRKVPQFTSKYRFSENLVEIDSKGDFEEIPISAIKVWPSFFWDFALKKLKKQTMHVSYGDGAAIPMSKKEVIRLMSTPSHSVVSIDGYKSKLITKAFEKYKRNTANTGNFVLIGHPKAFTPFSLKKLKQFIEDTAKEHKYCTYSNM